MMQDMDPSERPHRRYNPLLNEYILVSPHRSKRPWQGQTEPVQSLQLPQYDPSCYLCPGNKRAGGQLNPAYAGTHVFENDFAALLPSEETDDTTRDDGGLGGHPLLQSQPVAGFCDVIIFHPRHDLTLPRLDLASMERIVDEWTHIYERRGRQPGVKYVQIFENKGAMMGCSNPHPHGQAWSTSAIPSIPAKELQSLLAYSRTSPPPSSAPRGLDGRPCLLCEYAHLEVNNETRVVWRNEHWVALVPWWAVWPFELLVLSYKRHIPSLSECTDDEKRELASIILAVTIRYDNLFSCSFAYSMGIHQRPTPPSPANPSAPKEEEASASPNHKVGDTDTDTDTDVAHLHIHFTPPLLRSSTVRKFIVGFELMAEAQRDLTPEEAARRLRECSGIHYLDVDVDVPETGTAAAAGTVVEAEAEAKADPVVDPDPA